ncbi:MAG TPA: RHS repeat-associated core domain-containing protein, partial [Ignavibacteria bacterium]|nr:RHS repeat-associated core domain-containing protein [Ignavibacteria bacterium]
KYETAEEVYKFTGKERDKESGYDYFGARYYNSRIGRWGQVEPLLDKYVSFSPYCYGLNSPMVLKDVDGRDVYLGSMDFGKENFSTSLINDLKVITGLDLYLDDNGYLQANSSERTGGSETAANLILRAIDKEGGEINVVISELGESYAVASQNRIGLDAEQISSFITGAQNMEKNTSGWAMTFIHEMLHLNVGGNLKDNKKSYRIPEQGEVEYEVNKIRRDLGIDSYGQKYSYKSIKIGNTTYYPFDENSYSRLLINQESNTSDKFIKREE